MFNKNIVSYQFHNYLKVIHFLNIIVWQGGNAANGCGASHRRLLSEELTMVGTAGHWARCKGDTSMHRAGWEINK